MEVGLPFEVPQETGVRRKQQGKRREKISEVKSARQKSRREGRQSREGTGRVDGFSSFQVCQNSRISAAGF